MTIHDWLAQIGLERYATAFEENEVDLTVLPYLTDEDLRELGLSLGARRKLTAALTAEGSQHLEPADRDAVALPRREEAPTPAAERRHVTVMFCDIVGSTSLATRLGGEETRHVLRAFQDLCAGVVTRYGGFIARFMGDGILVYFGYPQAHENDAERAVGAGIDIIDGIRMAPVLREQEVAVRIGVASGEVIVGDIIGEGAAQEAAIIGDAPNLAARLQGLAEPNSIVISQSVQRQAKDRFMFEALQPRQVSGFDRPVPAWRVTGKGEFEADSGPSRPMEGSVFVGRKAECRQFRSLIDVCLETGCGAAVIVRGEPGIGKTRLTREFQSMAEQAGFACSKGLSLDFGVAKGRDAVGAIVRQLLDIPIGGDKETRMARVDAASAEGLIEPQHRIFFSDILDLPFTTEEKATYDAMENAVRSAGKQAAVAELIRSASASKPRLIVVEDLHWATEQTLDYVKSMAKAVFSCRALLVMTSRLEGAALDEGWVNAMRGNGLVTVDVGRLRAADSLELARTLMPGEDAFLNQCVERAEGNPLFLEQLMHSARDQMAEAIPASIQSLIVSRVDRLDRIDKLAIQAAAAIGQRFSLPVLHHLIGEQRYDCTALVRQLLIQPDGDGFLFAHALIQDVVYGSLLKETRQTLHRRAADWFDGKDAVLKAEHLDRAGDAGAADAYFAASRALADTFQLDRALPLAVRAAELARGHGDESQILSHCGMLNLALDALAAAVTCFESALAVAADGPSRVAAIFGLASCKRVTDDVAAAVDLTEAAIALAKDSDMPLDLAKLHHLRGNLFFPQARIDECREAHEKALEFARMADSRELEAKSLGGLGDAYYASGRMGTARRYFDDCVAISQEHGFGAVEMSYLSMRADTHVYHLDFARAAADLNRAIELAASVGNGRAEFFALWGLSYHELDIGFAPVDRVAARQSRERAIVEQLGLRRCEPLLEMTAAMIAAARGEGASATASLREAFDISVETGVTFVGPWVLGLLAATTADDELRLWALNEGARILDSETCVGHNYLCFYRYGIEAALGIGDWDRVMAFAAGLEAYSQREPIPWTDIVVARARALATLGAEPGNAEARLAAGEVLRLAERTGFNSLLLRLSMALAS